MKKSHILVVGLVVFGLLAIVNANADVVVLGKEVKEGVDEKGARGKGDGTILTYIPSKKGVYSSSFAAAGSNKLWSAATDLYNYFISSAPRLNTYSRSREGGSVWDIDKIGVRGRVWKNNALILDKTDMRYRSADASVYWKYSCPNYYCGGDFFARGDHTFQMRGYTSWYPYTTDTLKVGIF